MATKEELARIYQDLGITEEEAAELHARAESSGRAIYEKLHAALVNQPLFGIHNALQRILADWALIANEQVDPSMSPKEHLRHLAEEAAILAEIYRERDERR